MRLAAKQRSPKCMITRVGYQAREVVATRLFGLMSQAGDALAVSGEGFEDLVGGLPLLRRVGRPSAQPVTAVAPSGRTDSAARFTVITMAGALAAEAAAGLAGDLADLAATSFASPPWNEAPANAKQLTRQLLADARHPAFVLALAFAGHGPALAGFGYGLRRWPYPVAAGDGPALAGTEPFELCELAVRPAAQGHGTGRALHDAILAASGPQPRWLVTHPDAHPAVRLYHATGWHTGGCTPAAPTAPRGCS